MLDYLVVIIYSVVIIYHLFIIHLYNWEKQGTLLDSIFKNMCSQDSYSIRLHNEFLVKILEKDLIVWVNFQ